MIIKSFSTMSITRIAFSTDSGITIDKSKPPAQIIKKFFAAAIV